MQACDEGAIPSGRGRRKRPHTPPHRQEGGAKEAKDGASAPAPLHTGKKQVQKRQRTALAPHTAPHRQEAGAKEAEDGASAPTPLHTTPSLREGVIGLSGLLYRWAIPPFA